MKAGVRPSVELSRPVFPGTVIINSLIGSFPSKHGARGLVTLQGRLWGIAGLWVALAGLSEDQTQVSISTAVSRMDCRHPNEIIAGLQVNMWVHPTSTGTGPSEKLQSNCIMLYIPPPPPQCANIIPPK